MAGESDNKLGLLNNFYNSNYSGSTYNDNTNINDVDGKTGSNFWGNFVNMIPGLTSSVFNGVAAINNSKANQEAAKNNSMFWQFSNGMGQPAFGTTGVNRNNSWIIIVVIVVVLLLLFLFAFKRK